MPFPAPEKYLASLYRTQAGRHCFARPPAPRQAQARPDMGTRCAAQPRVLIVPGLNNSGPRHWQTRWQSLYPAFERVEQDRWDAPELDGWSRRLGQVLRGDDRPTLIVAHSFGCLATVHRASSGAPNLIGALLVAPADPDKFGVSDLLRAASLPCPSIVIGSADDPWMTMPRAAYWAKIWGGELVNAGAAGHINAESDLGYWKFGLSQLQRLVSAASVTT